MSNTYENNTSADESARKLSPAQKLLKELEIMYKRDGKEMPKITNKKGSFLIVSHKPNGSTTLSKKEIQPELSKKEIQPEQISEERRKYRELLDKKNEEEMEELNKLMSLPYSTETLIEMYREHDRKRIEWINSKGKEKTEE